ncbi:hypothetical protein UFOVP58_83 [uncultured Caudovirales phage]|uniref:Uncharacterized protein n=1 Tax=uncultured Caudovirales phage TaxID=2100421 RepID=A0A6J5KV52_9CAUD|nr:hypothetical protein UFOVP58_83 [uncultured Caudovirales phage]
MNDYEIAIKTIQEFFALTREEAIVRFEKLKVMTAEFYNNVYEEND